MYQWHLQPRHNTSNKTLTSIITHGMVTKRSIEIKILTHTTYSFNCSSYLFNILDNTCVFCCTDKNTAIRIWTPVEVERGNRTKQCNDCLGKVLLCTKGIFLKTKPSAGNRQKVHQKYSLRDRHLNRLFPLGRIQLILYGIHRCTCIVHSQ